MVAPKIINLQKLRETPFYTESLKAAEQYGITLINKAERAAEKAFDKVRAEQRDQLAHIEEVRRQQIADAHELIKQLQEAAFRRSVEFYTED